MYYNPHSHLALDRARDDAPAAAPAPRRPAASWDETRRRAASLLAALRRRSPATDPSAA